MCDETVFDLLLNTRASNLANEHSNRRGAGVRVAGMCESSVWWYGSVYTRENWSPRKHNCVSSWTMGASSVASVPFPFENVDRSKTEPSRACISGLAE